MGCDEVGPTGSIVQFGWWLQKERWNDEEDRKKVEEAKPDVWLTLQYVCAWRLGGRRELCRSASGHWAVRAAGCAVNLTCLPSSFVPLGGQ